MTYFIKIIQFDSYQNDINEKIIEINVSNREQAILKLNDLVYTYPHKIFKCKIFEAEEIAILDYESVSEI